MREACRDLVSAARGMANVNLRGNPCCIRVTFTERLRKPGRFFLLNEIDGAAAESASGESCANEAGKLVCEHDHGVGFSATSFKVFAVALVRLCHQSTKL